MAVANLKCRTCTETAVASCQKSIRGRRSLVPRPAFALRGLGAISKFALGLVYLGLRPILYLVGARADLFARRHFVPQRFPSRLLGVGGGTVTGLVNGVLRIIHCMFNRIGGFGNRVFAHRSFLRVAYTRDFPNKTVR